MPSKREQLNELLGRDIRTPFQVNPVLEATPFESDLAAGQARALQQRPEIDMARLQVAQADYNVGITRSERSATGPTPSDLLRSHRAAILYPYAKPQPYGPACCRIDENV